ncbi:MAG: hypothetical protein FIA96_10555 [Betaproteobacteria bacterium]|nr:hypothetical protein [Betaproteobacteria bacterium]
MDKEKEEMKKHTLRLLTVSAVYFSLCPAYAADAVAARATNPASATTTVAPATATIPASRIASRFEDLAGSQENAASLVAGLRSGSEITLTTADPASGVSFTPATRPMGYGNVTRALSLAQRQLAAQGIVEPTPEQLRLALNGGTTTIVDSSGATQTVQTPGVLQLRSQGMGWGQIAHQLSLSPSNRPLAAAGSASTTTTTSTAATQGGSNGHGGHGAIVSGDGSFIHGRAPGYGAANEPHAYKASAQMQKNAIQTSSSPSGGAVQKSVAGSQSKASIHARASGRF